MFHQYKEQLRNGFVHTTFFLSFIILLVQFQGYVKSQTIPADFFLDAAGISISTTSRYVCTLESVPSVEIGGRAVCWGVTKTSNIIPPDNELFVQIITASKFACGVTIDQRVLCWGILYADKIHQIEGLYTQLSGSRDFACGVLVDGNINCWPDGRYPLKTPEKGRFEFVQVSCSASHCVGLDRNAHAISWDINGIHGEDSFGFHKGMRNLKPPLIEISGQEGPDDFYIDEEEDEEEEEDMQKKEENVVMHMQFKQLSAYQGYTCGILYEDASLFCWGDMYFADAPYVKQGPFRQVSTGKFGVCTIHEDTNALDCIGTLEKFITHDKSVEYDQISVGDEVSCAITMDSRAKCFSKNRILREVPGDLILA